MVLPVGHNVTDLPSSKFSRPLTISDSGFLEILISQDQSKFHHQNMERNFTSNEEVFSKEIAKIRRVNAEKNRGTPLLISAPGSISFKEITREIRAAATTGIYQILFLVRVEKTSQLGVIQIDLPTFQRSGPKIEPFFLQITSEGRIYCGSGQSRTRMDTGNHDQELRNLCAQLELFRAAAESAGHPEPPCQIYVNPEVPYQRAIDLIALIKKYQLTPFFTNFAPEIPKRKDRMARKPTPPKPNSKIIPLDLAPKE